MQDSKGGTTTVSFDALNRQTAEQLGGTGVSLIQATRVYNAAGEVTAEGRQAWASMAWASAGTTTYDHDAAGRMITGRCLA